VYFQITVHIKGSLAENGAVFWDSRSTNSPLTYTVHIIAADLVFFILTCGPQVNEGQIMPALDRASLGLQVSSLSIWRMIMNVLDLFFSHAIILDMNRLEKFAGSPSRQQMLTVGLESTAPSHQQRNRVFTRIHIGRRHRKCWLGHSAQQGPHLRGGGEAVSSARVVFLG
jgi:hypothetical protein